jgi:hypothetical protein
VCLVENEFALMSKTKKKLFVILRTSVEHASIFDKDNDKDNKDKDECNDKTDEDKGTGKGKGEGKDKNKGKDKCNDKHKDHKNISFVPRRRQSGEERVAGKRQSEEGRDEKTETGILHLWSLGRCRLLLSGSSSGSGSG